MPINLTIAPIDRSLTSELKDRIERKTMPKGALGRLETLAMTIGLIQNRPEPSLERPCIMVFAADHGIAESGVSAYPQSVTAQMAINFLRGGAAINVFARQHRIKLLIVDAGIKADMRQSDGIINRKIDYGTANILNGPAMTEAQCRQAMAIGAELVQCQFHNGCNCIGFGEMGIGNTSSAALLMHAFTGLPLIDCVGRGTGLDDRRLENKLSLLQKAVDFHRNISSPIEKLFTYGGFEIAMMTGAYLQAAACRMLIVVDGFIAGSALLAAIALVPNVLDYCVFSHISSEHGHQALLDYLHAEPILNLGMRLGEGTGIAMVFPILESAVLFLNEMATFAEAGVDSVIHRC